MFKLLCFIIPCVCVSGKWETAMSIVKKTLSSWGVSKPFTSSVSDCGFIVPKCCSRITQHICEPKGKSLLVKNLRILLNSRRKSILDPSKFCLSASDLISTGLRLCQQVLSRSRSVQRWPLAKQPQGVSSAQPCNYLRGKSLFSNHRVVGADQGCKRGRRQQWLPFALTSSWRDHRGHWSQVCVVVWLTAARCLLTSFPGMWPFRRHNSLSQCGSSWFESQLFHAVT